VYRSRLSSNFDKFWKAELAKLELLYGQWASGVFMVLNTFIIVALFKRFVPFYVIK